MRMLMGLIVGVVLTVGTAWWADQGAGPGEPRMVNWDIVAQRTHEARVRLQDGWNHLASSFDRTPKEPAKGEGAT